MMTDINDAKRVYWHSRRGMLEIDLVFMPFAENVYPTLADDEKALYKRLLESEDTQLFAWVLEKEKPQDKDLAHIMEKILQYAKHRHI